MKKMLSLLLCMGLLLSTAGVFAEEIKCEHVFEGKKCGICGYEATDTTDAPAESPSQSPSVSPDPTKAPAESPSQSPSVSPDPTKAPAESPSQSPSTSPDPTKAPAESPSQDPSVSPDPTKAPAESPSQDPSVSPDPTKAPAESPSQDPSEAPTTEPTANPTQEPAAGQTNREEMYKTGWIIGAVVNVRASAGTDSGKLGVLYYGDRLTVLASVEDAHGDRWYEIMFNNRPGYIFNSLITFEGNPVKATAAATAEPTEEPTAEPTDEADEPSLIDDAVISRLTDEQWAMTDSLLLLIDEIEAVYEDAVSIGLVGSELVMTEEELERMHLLPVKEQMLVLLSAVGFREAVEAVIDDPQASLSISEEAQALMEETALRQEEMTEEEQAAFEETLLGHFPVDEVGLEDGTVYRLFAVRVLLSQDDEAHIERYVFRCDDEETGWYFTGLEIEEYIPEEVE